MTDSFKTPFSMVCKFRHSLPEGISPGGHTYTLENTYQVEDAGDKLELHLGRYGSLRICTPCNMGANVNSVEVCAELSAEQIARAVRSLLAELLRANLDCRGEETYKDLLQYCADQIAPEMARRSTVATEAE
jgi:hypothetical protein